MTRYHINENDKLVECRSWLRSCEFKDYSTEEEGRKALFLKKASAQYEADKKYVFEKFDNKNATRSFCSVDFSGMNKNKSLRKYINKLEEEFYSKGEKPDFFSCMSQLTQDNIKHNSSHQKVYASRIPSPDYENAQVSSKWSLIVQMPGRYSFNNDNVRYDLDLHNDFSNEIIRAERILREVVIANREGNTSVEEIDDQAAFLTKQLITAYTTIEELDSDVAGPYAIWINAEGYGTFAETDLTNFIVSVNYENSSFTPQMFNEFLHSNNYFKAIFPDVIDVRVYDDELGQSENSWSVRFREGKWRMFAWADGTTHGEEVESPEHAYNTIKGFVKNYMLTNDDETVEQKAAFVRDLISGVNESIQSFIKWKEENPLY